MDFLLSPVARASALFHVEHVLSFPSKAKTSPELIPETKLQSGGSVEFINQPIWQGIKSFELSVGTEVQNVKSLGFDSTPQLQDRKLSMLTQGTQITSCHSTL